MGSCSDRLERKRVAVDGVDQDLIGPKAPAVPFDVDVMHDLSGAHDSVPRYEHRLVELDPSSSEGSLRGRG